MWDRQANPIRRVRGGRAALVWPVRAGVAGDQLTAPGRELRVEAACLDCSGRLTVRMRDGARLECRPAARAGDADHQLQQPPHDHYGKQEHARSATHKPRTLPHTSKVQRTSPSDDHLVATQGLPAMVAAARDGRPLPIFMTLWAREGEPCGRPSRANPPAQPRVHPRRLIVIRLWGRGWLVSTLSSSQSGFQRTDKGPPLWIGCGTSRRQYQPDRYQQARRA